MLETADRQEDEAPEFRGAVDRAVDELRRQMRELQAMEQRVASAPDRQISLTDPDARAMATHGKGTGLVGYNVQAAVEADSHIVVAHEVTNLGHDRTQLATMGRQAKEATAPTTDRARRPRLLLRPGGARLRRAGIMPICPKPLTSGARAKVASASRTSSTSPRATPTDARRAKR